MASNIFFIILPVPGNLFNFIISAIQEKKNVFHIWRIMPKSYMQVNN